MCKYHLKYLRGEAKYLRGEVHPLKGLRGEVKYLRGEVHSSKIELRPKIVVLILAQFILLKIIIFYFTQCVRQLCYYGDVIPFDWKPTVEHDGGG